MDKFNPLSLIFEQKVVLYNKTYIKLFSKFNINVNFLKNFNQINKNIFENFQCFYYSELQKLI